MHLALKTEFLDFQTCPRPEILTLPRPYHEAVPSWCRSSLMVQSLFLRGAAAMRNQFLVFLLLATILYPRFSAPARAQTGRRSPKVGLALSGGGARGAAHIGVLKALEKTGIRVDYIAGTSFGALIGGFYALGYSPERIEEIFASQNWNDLFSDSPDRRLSPLIQRKNFRYLGELTIREFNVELPAGLWGGQKLTEVLNYYTTTQEMLDSGYDYDRLRIPFRAVATDLLSGKQYIFRRGPMAEAMRASIAIPMMFTPVEKDDMLLADGGLANNLPADVVREMGAEVVIAVDVTSSLLKKEEVRTFFDVMEQTLSIQMKQSLDRNLKFADAVLKPELEGFSYSSYAQIREISARGEQAALAKRDELRKLAVDAKQETYPVKSVEPARPMLESVTFVGLTRLDASQLQRELRSRANRRMDPITVRGDLGRLRLQRRGAGSCCLRPFIPIRRSPISSRTSSSRQRRRRLGCGSFSSPRCSSSAVSSPSIWSTATGIPAPLRRPATSSTSCSAQ